MKKIIVFSCCLLLQNFIFSSPSNFDTSFSNDGATTNLFLSNTVNQAQDLAVQADGKILTAGYAGDNGILVRYNNDGSLDETFNSNGTALNNGAPGYIITTLGAPSAIYGVAVQPQDQKIIIVGYTIKNAVPNAFIARYNHDGSQDTTFNANGTPGSIITKFHAQTKLFSVALQPTGEIVVTGWSMFNGFTNALVARYTPSGILDTTFNGTGYVTTLIGGIFTNARDVEIQTDGKIIITGQAQIDGTQGVIVIRYNTDGSLDVTFNAISDSNPNGTPGYTAPLVYFLTSSAYGMTLQPDQKIVIVGATNPFAPGFDNQFYTIIRLNSDGTLDQNFNAQDTPGLIISDIGLQANGVVLQSNGQIVTCGFSYANSYVLIVARYNSDGTYDATFDFTENQNFNALGNAIALQSNGKIIVTGTISTQYTQA